MGEGGEGWGSGGGEVGGWGVRVGDDDDLKKKNYLGEDEQEV